MVSEARRLAAQTFGSWGMDAEQINLACLLVSEVVTNAVLHAAITPSPGRELDPDLDPVMMAAPVGAPRTPDRYRRPAPPPGPAGTARPRAPVAGVPVLRGPARLGRRMPARAGSAPRVRAAVAPGGELRVGRSVRRRPAAAADPDGRGHR